MSDHAPTVRKVRAGKQIAPNAPLTPASPTDLQWEAQGLFPDEAHDAQEVLGRVITQQEITERELAKKAASRITFDMPYLLLVAVGDQHLGGTDVDYKACFADAERIARMPYTIVASLGDLVDNFVVGKLRQVRDGARTSIGDEQTLLKHYLGLFCPKLALVVSGNHDGWTEQLSGIDVFRGVLSTISPNALYDTDDLKVTITLRHNGQVVDFPGRIRHKWRGGITSNITGPIEKAFKEDQDFIWAIGGHVHASGLVRQFNAAGRTGIAAMVGSYKRSDRFAKQIGLPKPNDATAVALLFDAVAGTITGYNNLDMAERAIRALTGTR
jgi:hypothetical protein